jgi:hypothetical protein
MLNVKSRYPTVEKNGIENKLDVIAGPRTPIHTSPALTLATEPVSNGPIESNASAPVVPRPTQSSGVPAPAPAAPKQRATTEVSDVVSNSSDADPGLSLDYDFINNVRKGSATLPSEYDKKQSRSVELVSMKNMLWLAATKGGAAMWWVKFYGGRIISVVNVWHAKSDDEIGMLSSKLIRNDDPVATFALESLGHGKGLAVGPGAGLYFTEHGVFRMVDRDRASSDAKYTNIELRFVRMDGLTVNFRRVELNQSNGYNNDRDDQNYSQNGDQGEASHEGRPSPNSQGDATRRTDQPTRGRGGYRGGGSRYAKR